MNAPELALVSSVVQDARIQRHRFFRRLLATAVTSAGIAHLVAPGPFVDIVPKALPQPKLLVLISGVAEIAGGVGLTLPPLRRAAGWGLVALFIAVFPANLNMALRLSPEASAWTKALLWLRLPLQIPLVLWAWQYARPKPLPTLHG